MRESSLSSYYRHNNRTIAVLDDIVAEGSVAGDGNIILMDSVAPPAVGEKEFQNRSPATNDKSIANCLKRMGHSNLNWRTKRTDCLCDYEMSPNLAQEELLTAKMAGKLDRLDSRRRQLSHRCREPSPLDESGRGLRMSASASWNPRATAAEEEETIRTHHSGIHDDSFSLCRPPYLSRLTPCEINEKNSSAFGDFDDIQTPATVAAFIRSTAHNPNWQAHREGFEVLWNNNKNGGGPDHELHRRLHNLQLPSTDTSTREGAGDVRPENSRCLIRPLMNSTEQSLVKNQSITPGAASFLSMTSAERWSDHCLDQSGRGRSGTPQHGHRGCTRTNRFSSFDHPYVPHKITEEDLNCSSDSSTLDEEVEEQNNDDNDEDDDNDENDDKNGVDDDLVTIATAIGSISDGSGSCRVSQPSCNDAKPNSNPNEESLQCRPATKPLFEMYSYQPLRRHVPAAGSPATVEQQKNGAILRKEMQSRTSFHQLPVASRAAAGRDDNSSESESNWENYNPVNLKTQCRRQLSSHAPSSRPCIGRLPSAKRIPAVISSSSSSSSVSPESCNSQLFLSRMSKLCVYMNPAHVVNAITSGVECRSHMREVPPPMAAPCRVGEGSNGVVFKGYLSCGSAVAVKIISLDEDNADEQHEGFEREITTLSMYRHPNIVCLLGFSVEETKRLLIYEYLELGDLSRILHSRPVTASHRPAADDETAWRAAMVLSSWQRRLEVAIDAAQALAFLHTRQPKVFHRDIKSGNIVLAKNGTAKLADFGLAERARPEHPDKLIITKHQGTLGYVDPRIIETSEVDESTEVFSLGIVLLELLTGRPPAAYVDRGAAGRRRVWGDDEDDDRSSCPQRKTPLQGERLLTYFIDHIDINSPPSVLPYLDRRCPWPYLLSIEWAKLALRCIRTVRKKRPGTVDVLRRLKTMYVTAKKMSTRRSMASVVASRSAGFSSALSYSTERGDRPGPFGY